MAEEAVWSFELAGGYQKCGENHLHRYLAEFDSRYMRAPLWASTTPSALTRR